jgi:acyl-CoA synthetase (AMP-forming)/AMP-acid ligase II
MHPSVHARTQPDKPAIVMAGSGDTLTFAELDARSNQAAQFFRSKGLAAGDTIAMCMDNRIEYFPVIWGAQRSGLVCVAISSRLTAPEMDYILSDSGSRLLIASAYLGSELDRLTSGVERFIVGGEKPGWADWTAAIDAMPTTPIPDERAGTDMLYSSGTTGRPKGVRLPLPETATSPARIA